VTSFHSDPQALSTTAAVIAIFQIITNLLSVHPYVIVISLDFIKEFDRVCHATLLHKFAQLDIPDDVYNWLADYFTGHSHCSTSSLCQISASIVQGSAIGPVSYVVNASDLRAATPGNDLRKYADDTYVIIPAANKRSRCSELDHIQHWAKTNTSCLTATSLKKLLLPSVAAVSELSTRRHVRLAFSECRRSKYSASLSQTSSP